MSPSGAPAPAASAVVVRESFYARTGTFMLPPADIAKVCGCCRAEHTWPAWLLLENVGLQDDGDGGFLRLRNCVCGSTIAVEQAEEATARMFLFLGAS